MFYVLELDEAVEKAKSKEIRIPFGAGFAGITAQTKQLLNITNAYEVNIGEKCLFLYVREMRL